MHIAIFNFLQNLVICLLSQRHFPIFKVEVCSCSNLGDAQARRLHIRVKGKDGKTYLAHTLNNTCVAPPRMLIAFLENHLQADGSVTIPKVLQPYMGGLEVMVPTHKKG